MTPSSDSTESVVTDPAVWSTAGALVPSIELPRIDGQGSVDLAAYRGKKVLLLQFASW